MLTWIAGLVLATLVWIALLLVGMEGHILAIESHLLNLRTEQSARHVDLVAGRPLNRMWIRRLILKAMHIGAWRGSVISYQRPPSPIQLPGIPFRPSKVSGSLKTLSTPVAAHSTSLFPHSLLFRCLAVPIRATTSRCHAKNSSRRRTASPSRHLAPPNSRRPSRKDGRSPWRSPAVAGRKGQNGTEFLIATPQN